MHAILDNDGLFEAIERTNKWNRAVETLASMCVSDMTGRGPTKGAFILTLRNYADEMEKLIQAEIKTRHE